MVLNAIWRFFVPEKIPKVEFSLFTFKNVNAIVGSG